MYTNVTKCIWKLYEYIYKNILSKVNMNYVMKEYDWIGTIVGGEE